jgi:hypothetical protein
VAPATTAERVVGGVRARARALGLVAPDLEAQLLAAAGTRGTRRLTRLQRLATTAESTGFTRIARLARRMIR